jgi:predicted AAA+ superfamily ATPase
MVKMLAMYTRRQIPPSRSFFLFGPRGTGKTTWLRQKLKEARWYNLIHEAELVRLIRDPGLLAREASHLPKASWVVIDEVQRAPVLLDEVHDLISLRSDLRFALTGSSARKLRRGQANLLAGRAVTRQFFPLVASEFGFAVPVDDILSFGCLPHVRSERDRAARVEILEAYGATYLAEEIRAEALVKNLSSFARFLEVAALMNGQVTNVSSISRDAGVARPTVQGYFDVLVDTLVGTWLPAHRPRVRIKEVGHPKFYFFDTGVVRSLSRQLREPIESAQRGPLLETYVLHELRSYMGDSGCGGELSYWRTPGGAEVDFIWTRGKKRVAIEVKASARWRPEEGRSLREFSSGAAKTKCLAVYLGQAAMWKPRGRPRFAPARKCTAFM